MDATTSSIPTMSELLTASYPPVITQTQIAAIFGQHVQTVRKLARDGRLPFPNVSISGVEKRYRLTDIIAYLETPTPTASVTTEKRRGRPVGSRNKPTHAPE